MDRLRDLRDAVAVKACGRTVESVEVGVVTSEVAAARKEALIGGEQEFLTLHFSDGTSLRIESRSGYKDEGGFLVTKKSD